MVALVEVTVDHEPVELGVGLVCLIIGGDNDRHVVEADAGAAFLADVRLDELLVDILGDAVPRVISLGHDVGNGSHNGRQVFYALSVRTHGQFLDSVCGSTIIDHIAADCKVGGGANVKKKMDK